MRLEIEYPPQLRLQWTDPAPPNNEVRYDHVIAETPFGRILITWKSWKDYPGYTIDEHPVDTFHSGNDLESTKRLAENMYFKAIAASLPEGYKVVPIRGYKIDIDQVWADSDRSAAPFQWRFIYNAMVGAVVDIFDLENK